jgi:hypothetical protein
MNPAEPLPLPQSSPMQLGRIRTRPLSRSSPPIFNLPPVIAATSGLLVLIHAVRSIVDQATDLQFLLWLAFIPARYDSTLPIRLPLPGGEAADVMDLRHLCAPAWRCGASGRQSRLVPGLWQRGGVALRIGAVCCISGRDRSRRCGRPSRHAFRRVRAACRCFGGDFGAMAAALRFAFEAGGPLGYFRDGSQQAFFVPAAPLSQALRNPQVLVFLGVWFAINLIFGLGTLAGCSWQRNDRLAGPYRGVPRRASVVPAVRSGPPPRINACRLRRSDSDLRRGLGAWR